MKRILAVALAFTLAQQTPADRLRQLAEDILAALGPPKVPIAVSPAVDLQAVIDAAKPGDVLALPPGAVYTGNFVLPTGLTLTTAGTLPAGRTGPGAPFAKLVSPNASPALFIPSGQDLTLSGLEVSCNGGGECVSLGDGSSAQNTLSQVPQRILLDRVYVHGDPVNGQKRCVGLNSGETTIKDSYISDCKAVGQDSQAIGGWNGPGPYAITNNYLEGAGENMMLGGSDPPIPNLVPCDITVRDNTLNKPATLRNSVWQVKNIFELKNACRVTVDHNTLTNNWSAAQNGYAVLFTPRNQDGACPWCGVRDVTFTNNIIRHVAGGISILASDNNHPSLTTTNIAILNNLIDDLDPIAYKNEQTGDVGTGRALAIVGGPQQIEIAHLTVTGQHLNSWLTLGGAAVVGLTVRDSVMEEGDYGLKVDGGGMGLAALLLHSPGSILTRNVILHAADRFIDYGANNARQADGILPSPFAASDGSTVGVDLAKLPR